MVLVRRDKDVAIRIGNRTLMSSDVHDSEDELGARRRGRGRQRGEAAELLIGGLGLGFSACVRRSTGFPATARVDVAELMPEVVRWNKAEHGGCGTAARGPAREAVRRGRGRGDRARGESLQRDLARRR